MGSYLLVFFVAAALSALFMPLLMSLAVRVGAMDNTQDPPVPRVGGWALTVGSAVSLVLVGIIFRPTGATLSATATSLLPVVLGSLAILALGTVDDIVPLQAWLKFAIQIAIAAGVCALGVRVDTVSFPFADLELGAGVGTVVTILWLVGVANAFNLLDGADGIAAGSAFFAATAIFLMSVTLGHPAIGLVTAALAGAILGFLPFNFPPARAYLGDSGSLVTGFLLAGLAVEGSTKGPTLVTIAVPVIAFGVPVFDTTITLLRRFVRGRPLFERDQEHVHHGLLRAGLTPRQVAGVVYVASAAFALAAMLFLNTGVRSYAVALVVVGAGVWVVARHLRLHELNELARVAKFGALKPRSIMANVELRRATERLAAATSISDLHRGLAILLGESEFDDVQLSVAPITDRRGNTRTWQLKDGAFVEGGSRRSGDEWEVVFPFEGADWVGELQLRRRLGRRSLVLDFNLVLELVQPALVEAATRIDAEAALTV